eukprot:scaffold36104_cov72-Isochrysis_galbana.AAC.2
MARGGGEGAGPGGAGPKEVARQGTGRGSLRPPPLRTGAACGTRTARRQRPNDRRTAARREEAAVTCRTPGRCTGCRRPPCRYAHLPRRGLGRRRPRRQGG